MRRADLRAWLFATSVTSEHAVIVYMVLLAHADTAGQSWPSVPTIASAARVGLTTVRGALQDLEEAGEIVSHARKGRATVYALTAYPTVTQGGTPPSGEGDPTKNPTTSDPKPPRQTVTKVLEGKGRAMNNNPSNATDLPGTGRVAWYTPPPDPPDWNPDPDERARIVAELQTRRRHGEGNR